MKENNKLKCWFLATRPKTLWAGICPVMLATAFAYATDTMHWPSALVCLLASLFIQIGTNFANDYFDFIKGADTEERVGPMRLTQAGLIDKKTMRNAFILMFVCAGLCTAYLFTRGGMPILIILIISIICGVLYTGGPFPLGYNGLGDLFAFVFFGPVATAATWYIQSTNTSYLTETIIIGIGLGCFSIAMIDVNNMRDMETDKKVGKRTLPVLLGRKFAQIEFLAALLGAVIVPVIIYSRMPDYPLIFMSFLFILPAIPATKLVLGSKGAILNKALAMSGVMLLIYSFFFSLGFLLS